MRTGPSEDPRQFSFTRSVLIRHSLLYPLLIVLTHVHICQGHIRTKMTAALLDVEPGLEAKWANSNPLGRLGRPEELRGVISWLSSDASTFCTGSELSIRIDISELSRSLD